MDIEDLDKTQLILLTLLTSFVTSIATGILTVYLLNEVPGTITQTINRVVEKTVEKVVPGVSTKEVQVVIKEDDTISAIAASEKLKIVRLVSSETSSSTPVASRQYVGIGFLLPKESMILTDVNFVGEVGSKLVSAELSDRRIIPAEVASQSADGVAALSIVLPKDFKVEEESAFLDPNAVSLGQKVFVISGVSSSRITIGNVTELEERGSGGSELPTKELPPNIKTNLSLRNSDSGAPIFGTDGSIIGIIIMREGGISVVTTNIIKSLVDKKGGTPAAVGASVPAQ